ncbi:MAG: hypothetical protein KGS45_00820 [Planctomycetes bacterium]|nr:hypothetical protein [Planctomycetota bacterium]
MFLSSPTRVTFGSLLLSSVSSISIDRTASREAIDFSDAGPHPTFADIPEQKVLITILQYLTSSDFAAPLPSSSATLTIHAKPNDSDSGSLTLQASTVVRSCTHSLNPKGATRTISLIAISTNGATDPITIL